MARATAEIADNPRFYNTMTGNCTNLLAEAINRAKPGRLPYDLAWNLPALSVGYLIDEGLIDSKGMSVEESREAAVINDLTDEQRNGRPARVHDTAGGLAAQGGIGRG